MPRYPRYSRWPAALLAAALALAQSQEKRMSPTFRDSSEKVAAPERPPVVIHDAAGAPASAVVAPPPSGTSQRLVNGARNSRLPVHWTGALNVRWQTDLPPHFTPVAVLAGHGRIVVEGTDDWLLLDSSGRILHRDRRGAGELTLDASHGLLYVPDSIGYLGAHSLDDGRRAFYLPALFDSSFDRALIERQDKRLWMVSVQRPFDAHDRVPPHISSIEMQEFGEPSHVNDDGLLTSARRAGYLMGDTACLLPAISDGSLALATDNALILASLDLKFQGELTGAFHPLFLSVDEEPRFYLIVASGPATEFWVVKGSGERAVHLRLPPGFPPTMPPLVGYDHSVFLAGERRLMALAPAGGVLWEKELESTLAGAVVLPDHRVLAAIGSELAAFDSAGKRERVFLANGDSLMTAPSATERGGLLVAGSRRIYSLGAR